MCSNPALSQAVGIGGPAFHSGENDVDEAVQDYVIWHEELIVRYSVYPLCNDWPFKEGEEEEEETL